MWEANGKGDDAMLWAGTNFFGGLSRHREGVCGVVSAMAVYLGFHFRSCSEDETETNEAKEKARAEASRMAQEFKDKYNSIICDGLLDVPNTGLEDVKRYMESEERKEQCNGYVRFMVEQLYNLG
ncbi:MAG: C_GCAxxG_C_C family protein [Dehalococcoidales bacterium]|nr:MAG: C_GCAxxG_C_C family protein [Dehalococcoidales bacterium]